MSDSTMILPKETAQALVDLTGEVRVDAALTMIIRDYARQKLAELEAGLRQFEGLPSHLGNRRSTGRLYLQG